MSYDNVTTLVKDHPVETIAVVVTVGLIASLCYNHKQKKAYELELAKYRAMRPPWWTRLGRRRHAQPNLTLVA